MIVLYPLITSEDISPTALPGVCKMLERYLLIYRTNDVMGKIKGQTNVNIKVSPFSVKEGEEIDEEITEQTSQSSSGTFHGGGKGGGGKGKPTDDIASMGVGGSGPPNVKLNFFMDDLSLEPTFVHVQGAGGAKVLIGVKVVPFKMQDDRKQRERIMKKLERLRTRTNECDNSREPDKCRAKYAKAIAKLEQKLETLGSLSTYMTQEKNRNYIARKLLKHVRKLSHVYYIIIQKIPILRDFIGGLKGDPKKDIVWGGGGLNFKRDEIFLLLNKKDFAEDFFKDHGGLRKLFDAQWGSIIVADDSQQTATFCMKELKGLCSTMNYTQMMANFGKDQYKAYESISDLSRSSGPMFRQKVPPRRIFGESMAGSKLREYDSNKVEEILEGYDFLSEDFKNFLSAMNPMKIKKMQKDMEVTAKSGDISKADRTLNAVPEVPMNKIEATMAKMSPQFTRSYVFAQKVVQNSAQELPSDMVKPISCAIAFKATYNKEGDGISNTRDELKKDIPFLMKTITRIGRGLGWAGLWVAFCLHMMWGAGPIAVGLLFILARSAKKIAKDAENRMNEPKERQDKIDKRKEKYKRDIEIAKAKQAPPTVNIQQG